MAPSGSSGVPFLYYLYICTLKVGAVNPWPKTLLVRSQKFPIWSVSPLYSALNCAVSSYSYISLPLVIPSPLVKWSLDANRQKGTQTWVLLIPESRSRGSWLFLACQTMRCEMGSQRLISSPPRSRKTMISRVLKYSHLQRGQFPANFSKAMLYAAGIPDKRTMKTSPQVGIASVWWEGNPCNMHLLDLGKEVKKAVTNQGMLGWQYNTVGVSDAITMGGEGMIFYLASANLTPIQGCDFHSKLEN